MLKTAGAAGYPGDLERPETLASDVTAPGAVINCAKGPGLLADLATMDYSDQRPVDGVSLHAGLNRFRLAGNSIIES